MEYKTNPLTIVLTIVITAIIVAGGFFFSQNQESENAEPTVMEEGIEADKVSTEEKGIVIPEASTETKTYTSEKYALSFDHPKNWAVFETTTQLDVKPPSSPLSNYFTLEKASDSPYAKYKTLEEYLVNHDLGKAEFTIDGKEVYADSKSSAAGTMLTFYFSHQDKLYKLRMFDTWYEMPEVQAMINSLRLN